MRSRPNAPPTRARVAHLLDEHLHLPGGLLYLRHVHKTGGSTVRHIFHDFSDWTGARVRPRAPGPCGEPHESDRHTPRPAVTDYMPFKSDVDRCAAARARPGGSDPRRGGGAPLQRSVDPEAHPPGIRRFESRR